MNSVFLWVALIALVVSALFSALSYALRMMSRVLLEQALLRRHRAGALDQILDFRHDLSLSSSALRLLANATVILGTAAYFHTNFPQDPVRVYGYTILVTVPALLVASVGVPQALAKYAGESMIATLWPLIRVAHWALYPLVAMLNVVDELIRRLAGVTIGDDPDTEAEQVEQEIMAVVSEGTAEGTVDEEQKKMIEGVISFRDSQVGQIMTPRTEVIAIEVNAPVMEVRDKILKEGLSRVPVFEGTLDNVIGILYAKDLLGFLDTRNAPGTAVDFPPIEINVRKIMRAPVFVPATKPLRDLLREMRVGQVHMAIVLDEYGGTAGLVTTEDIIEEIVGEIADEYERPEPEELKRIDERTVEVDARMNIAELNRALDLHLPEDQDYATIGGFVISALGAIPPKGERLQHDGLAITVLDAEPRRVKKLRLDLPEPETAESAEAGEGEGGW